MFIGFGFAVRGALIPGVVIAVGAACSSPGFSAGCSPLCWAGAAVMPRASNAQAPAPVMMLFFNVFIARAFRSTVRDQKDNTPDRASQLSMGYRLHPEASGVPSTNQPVARRFTSSRTLRKAAFLSTCVVETE